MEAALTQEAWAKAAGIGNLGRNSCSNLYVSLVATWRARNVVGPLHLLCDDILEEK